MTSLTTNFQIDYELANLTSRELAEQIIGRLEKTFSIDLLSIFEADSLDERQKIRRFRDELVNGILVRAESENLQEFFMEPEDYPCSIERDHLRGLEGTDGDIEIEPNIALTESDAQYVKSLRGNDLKTYLLTLLKRFENMAEAKSAGALAAELIGGGLVSVGVPAAIGTINALRAGGVTFVAAIRAGITSIGLKTAIVAVVVVLAALLLWLFLENPKKVLGMVINQTDEDFVVKNFQDEDGGLFVESGEMLNFMEDNRDGLGSPKIQLKQRLSFGEGDEDNVVFAGIYFADKKFGLTGTAGVMVFSSTASDLRFAHLWTSPYTRDNGTNMKLVSGTDDLNLEKIFDKLFDDREVHVEVSSEEFVLQATVNDPRGGFVGSIASIEAVAS